MLRKFVSILTISLALATAFPTAAQDAQAPDEQGRELALAALEPAERDALLKTPETLREEFQRAVREGASQLFATTPDAQGETAPLSEAQNAALDAFVAPFLEEPRRPLTDDEKNAVAEAFALSKDDVELRAAAFEAFLCDFFDADPIRVAGVLFGEKIAENFATASYDELQVKLAALLENHTPIQLLDEIQKRSVFEQKIFLDCLLTRLGDRFDDHSYAHTLNDTVKIFLAPRIGEPATVDTIAYNSKVYAYVEKLLEEAAKARPDAWEVSYVLARTIWRDLPKTLKPSDDPDSVPLRVSHPSPNDDSTTLRADERDRALVLQTLARTLPAAFDAAGTRPTEKRELARPIVAGMAGPIVNHEVGDVKFYFQTLVDALRLNAPGAVKTVDLKQKTDLTTLPPLRSEKEWKSDASRPVVVPNDYRSAGDFLPNSFDDAANDGERLAYASILQRAASDVARYDGNHTLFLARVGQELQKRLGVEAALLGVARARNYRATPTSPTDDPQRLQLERTAKLDQILAEIPTLKDDESFVVPPHVAVVGAPPSETIFDAQRRALAPSCNFIAILKESLAREENADALVALATEYQLRGDYRQAFELWKRAKTAKLLSAASVASFLGNRSSSEDMARVFVLQQCDANAAKLQSATTLRIEPDGSEAKGMRVALRVTAPNVKRLKTTFYQLDLAPYIAKTREPSFYAATGQAKLFANLVAEDVQEKFASSYPVESYAQEVQSSIDDLPSRENGALADPVALTFTLEKPGAYVVKVADADNDAKAVYALAFANRYVFAYQFGQILVSDWQTGKPCANREIELLNISMNGRSSEAKATTVATDDMGVFKPQSASLGAMRTVAFVHDEGQDDQDRSVSFFDSLCNPYATGPALGAINLRQYADSLVLSTPRPVYEPGETVEFVGQAVSQSEESFGQNTAWTVSVVEKKATPTPPNTTGAPAASSRPNYREIAKFPVNLDENGSFSGSFQIPDDAAPGEYMMGLGLVLREMSTNKTAVLWRYRTTLYVSKRGEVAAQEQPATSAANDAKVQAEESGAPMVETTFDKQYYQIGRDAAAKLVFRSSIPDANVAIAKFRPNSQTEALKRVELRDGVGEAEIALDPNDAPYSMLTLNVAANDEAQTLYYLVGERKKNFVHDASLEAPANVRPGDKVAVTAKFAQTDDGDASFAGRASLVLFDAKLDVAPLDDFSAYLNGLQLDNRFILRQDYPATRLLNARALPPSRRNQTPSTAVASQNSPRIYGDFVKTPALPPALDSNDFFHVDVATRSRDEVPFVLKEVPTIPESANRDSVLKETTAKARVDSLSFEFDAPKTPGTYRMVFRAFDPEKSAATYVVKDLTVE